MHYTCIACITIDSVMKMKKKNYPQVYLQECKYRMKKTKILKHWIRVRVRVTVWRWNRVKIRVRIWRWITVNLFLTVILYFKIYIDGCFGACVTYGTPCRNSGHPLFSLTHVAQHHTVVIRYSTRVTKRTPCYVNGHLVIYHECNGYERASLL